MRSLSWSEWLAAQEARIGADLRQTRDFVLARAGIRAGETVLDLGTGRGPLALAAAERLGTRGMVIALDADAGCLGAVRTAARLSTFGPHITLVQADATSLPFVGTSVDVVVTRSVLEFVADRATAAREMYRTLRAGGRISCFETINRYLTPHHHLLDLQPLGELGEQVIQMFEGIYTDEAEPMLTFDERDLVALFEQAGFVDVGLNFLIRWRSYQLTAEQARERLVERGAANRPTIMELVSSRLGDEAARRYGDYFVEAAPRQPFAVRSGSAFVWGRKPA